MYPTAVEKIQCLYTEKAPGRDWEHKEIQSSHPNYSQPLAILHTNHCPKGAIPNLCSEFRVHHYRLKTPLIHRLKANFTARSCCPNTSVQLESWDLQGVQSSYKVSCWELIKQLLCYQNLCLKSLISFQTFEYRWSPVMWDTEPSQMLPTVGVRTVLTGHGAHLPQAPTVQIHGWVLQHRLLHQGNQFSHDVTPSMHSAK